MVESVPVQKPTPAYLHPDYPYQAVGNPITNMDELQDEGVLYEINCHECEMSIRSQGKNIKQTYARLMAGDGCIGCGNKDLEVRRVNTSKAE